MSMESVDLFSSLPDFGPVIFCRFAPAGLVSQLVNTFCGISSGTVTSGRRRPMAVTTAIALTCRRGRRTRTTTAIGRTGIPCVVSDKFDLFVSCSEACRPPNFNTA